MQPLATLSPCGGRHIQLADMRAAVYYGPNKLEIDDVAEPAPKPGTVKLKVGLQRHLRHRPARVLRRADLRSHRTPPADRPAVAADARPRILRGHHRRRRRRDRLERGRSRRHHADLQMRALRPVPGGQLQHLSADRLPRLMSDGGMAEYTVVPTDMLHRLPDNVSLELGALVEPMSVAYHAATLGEPQRRVTPSMVFGAGPIGIGLWFALRGKGVEDVFVVEPSADPAGVHRGARCAAPWTRPTVDVPAFIADHTGGAGADAVFDAAGVAPAVETALACVGCPPTDGQRRDLREAADHSTAQSGDERVANPGFAVLHRCRLRGGHRADGRRQATTRPAG